MQLHFSPSMRSITISSSSSGVNSNGGGGDLMKIKVAPRHISYRTLFHTILTLAFLLPFVFILTAVVTLEGVNKCSSFDCLGRRLGPKLLGRTDDPGRVVKDFVKILNQVNSEKVPHRLKLPESFSQLVTEMKNNKYSTKEFALILKGMEPNAAAVQNWVAAVWQLGTSLGAAGVTVPSGDVQNTFPANTTSAFWTNPAVQSQRNASWKKTPKKTKVVQSAWCEVCKIECNSKDVFDQHKLGKKHKKNMEKLNGITSTFVAASASFIGPQEKQDKEKATGGQKAQKRVAQQMEDLETKRRKVLEGGAPADAVRACVFCNVVCNSETVFNHHLAGQKHASMVKKHAVAGAT